MYKRFSRNILKLIGICLFAYIVSTLDLRSLASCLRQTNIAMFVSGFSLLILNIYIKSQRWRYLAKINADVSISVFSAFSYYWAAIFWGAVTPGKVGELYKVKYLSAHGAKNGAALAVTLIDRLSDVLVLLLAAGAGMFFMSIGQSSERIAVVVSLAVFVVLIVCLKLIPDKLKDILQNKVRELLNNKFPAFAQEDPVKDFFAAFRTKGFDKVPFVVFLTVLSWFVFASQRYIIALSMGVEIPFLDFVIIILVTAIVSMIPVSVNGIGTRDAVLIYFLSSYGYDKETSVALSALILLVMIFNMFIGYIFYLRGDRYTLR